MKKADAKRAIEFEWSKLPEAERQTEQQAVQFALKLSTSRPDIASAFSVDSYQDIMAVLNRYKVRAGLP
jgi:hypothetical protein